MRVGGIIDMSTIDWYGNVSLVLFFAGCNIRCPYCQNGELIPSDSGMLVGLDYLKERIEMNMDPVPQLDSVVFTGGEPLLQSEAVIGAGRLVKDYGLKVMLDTNGTLSENLRKVLLSGVVDRVALDVKAPLNHIDYGRVSGLPEMGDVLSRQVDTSLRLCKEIGVDVEARTTIVPGLSDGHEFIARLVKDLKDYCLVYYLQQFDNLGEVLDPELKSLEAPSKEQMVSLAQVAIDAGLSSVYIKTRTEGLERVS